MLPSVCSFQRSTRPTTRELRWPTALCAALLLISIWLPIAECMSYDQLQALRQETIEVFYHGFDSYMTYAFPEDELKPISCSPMTRDRGNPAHIEVNDVLGNYSLTLIDSLSTLAILASSTDAPVIGRNPLADFQGGIQSLVHLYGDGSEGAHGQGTRSRGFNLDSKVQVFETVIRGVGGLLSAHLFAVGDLPIMRYNPLQDLGDTSAGWDKHRHARIQWQDGFIYDGQLLRLATDLASRLLPAFHSVTGLPYPRVNLQYGIPFYPNSPLHYDAERGQCEASQSSQPLEVTETCSAGAGSLVLEFTTLSRLTGDPRFEDAAKRAFWAVWERRTAIGLIGAGIDAETGLWVAPFSGIGAGIDSFFEYAFKSHILLSGFSEAKSVDGTTPDFDFLAVWLEAHAGIKRHIYRGSAYQHPHYIQSDLYTGAARAFWIDSLSAYYPGLLTLAGELDEAISSHMLYTALWSRYSSLPERWSTATGNIDSGLRWWGGRPEFIESTWYLYRATQDPWYLHVGEMTLRDIKRRCWTECGWAGLEDVRTGELKDRMESFFLGETVKYLFLLFDPTHPLNTLDAPFVFTTEGHPLILPESTRQNRNPKRDPLRPREPELTMISTCPAPPLNIPFSISATISRQDFFHAASLARLHQLPKLGEPTATVVESAYDYTTFAEVMDDSPTSFIFYPWTIPTKYVPANGTSSKMESRVTFDLTFSAGKNAAGPPLRVERVERGIMIHAIGGLRIGLIREPDMFETYGRKDIFRVYAVAQVGLGRDEEVFVPVEAVKYLNTADPYFTRRRELDFVDLIIEEAPPVEEVVEEEPLPASSNQSILTLDTAILEQQNLHGGNDDTSLLSMLLQQFASALEGGQLPFSAILQGAIPSSNEATQTKDRLALSASVSTGVGAAPLPEVLDAPLNGDVPLGWTSIYMSDETCEDKLPASVPRKHQIIVMKRGGCSFSQKLRNIPSLTPSISSLQLVVVVSGYPDGDVDGGHLVRPLLDEMQYTSGGIVRFNGIPLIMVEGGDETWEMLKRAKGVGLRRRYWFESQGLRISNLFVV